MREAGTGTSATAWKCQESSACGSQLVRAGEWQIGLGLFARILQSSERVAWQLWSMLSRSSSCMCRDVQDCLAEAMRACGLGFCWQGAISLLLRSDKQACSKHVGTQRLSMNNLHALRLMIYAVRLKAHALSSGAWRERRSQDIEDWNFVLTTCRRSEQWQAGPSRGGHGWMLS